MTALLIILVVLGSVCVLIAAMILRGWVLSVMWGWFAVPIFNLPPLSIPQAIGIAILTGLLVHQCVPSKDGDAWAPIATALITPFVALLMGYVVKGYM